MDNEFNDEKDVTEQDSNTQEIDLIISDVKKNDNLFVIAPDDEDISKPVVKKKPKKKRTGCLTSFVWIAIIGIFSLTIAFFVIITASDFLGIGKNDNVVSIEINENNISEIPEMLQKEGAISYPFIFKLYMKLTKAGGDFQTGVHDIQPHAGYSGIVNELKKIRENRPEVKVTIKEGVGVDEIIDLLDKKGVVTKAEFKDAMRKGNYNKYRFVKGIPVEKVYYIFEGYLFPDTYNFFEDSTGETAVNKLLSQMDKKLTDDMYTKAEKMGYTMHEIITLASIIEKEAGGSSDEMKNVAAVFYNRLNWKDQPRLLGSTPTASYPHGGDRYDTNKHEGLPPGPVCSPSLAAIEAALNPTPDFKATYFVTDKNKKFYYRNSLKEHNNIIASLKNQGLWEY